VAGVPIMATTCRMWRSAAGRGRVVGLGPPAVARYVRFVPGAGLSAVVVILVHRKAVSRVMVVVAFMPAR
jgi:hypothetical protein